MPHETTQAVALLQLVTVHPLGGQETVHPLGGQATSHWPEVSHETWQVPALLQSTSQLGAPLQATEHTLPGSQTRSQSSSAVHTHVLGLLHVSSEPQPAAAAAQRTVKVRAKKERIGEVELFTRFFLGTARDTYAARRREGDITPTSRGRRPASRGAGQPRAV